LFRFVTALGQASRIFTSLFSIERLPPTMPQINFFNPGEL
jgi:hypothetical protein